MHESQRCAHALDASFQVPSCRQTQVRFSEPLLLESRLTSKEHLVLVPGKSWEHAQGVLIKLLWVVRVVPSLADVRIAEGVSSVGQRDCLCTCQQKAVSKIEASESLRISLGECSQCVTAPMLQISQSTPR